MRSNEEELSIKRVELVLNGRVLLSILIVIGISIILSGCLASIFSGSLLTVLCGLIIGATVGILINYFLVTSHNLVKNVHIELSHDDVDDLYTKMKIR